MGESWAQEDTAQGRGGQEASPGHKPSSSRQGPICARSQTLECNPPLRVIRRTRGAEGHTAGLGHTQHQCQERPSAGLTALPRGTEVRRSRPICAPRRQQGWERGLGYGSWLGAHRTRSCALSLAGGEREGSANAGARGGTESHRVAPSRAGEGLTRDTLHVAGCGSLPASCTGFSGGLGSTVGSTSPSEYSARRGWGSAGQAAMGTAHRLCSRDSWGSSHLRR